MLTPLVRQTGGVAKKEKKMMKALGFIPSGISGFLLKESSGNGNIGQLGMHRRKCALEPNVVPWLRLVINRGMIDE